MKLSQHFEEEDLALYAMHLLAEPEASAVARSVASSEELRRRLAEIEAKLRAYAQTAVELHAAPEGSLERLLARIAQEKKVAGIPPISWKSDGSTIRRKSAEKILPWIGWALAAGLAVTAGKLYHDRTALNSMLVAQNGRVAHISASTTDLNHERNALSANLAEQAKELKSLRDTAAAQKSQGTALRTTIEEQTAKANELTASVANTARERDVLRGTVATQKSQIAQLTVQSAEAQSVLQALTDRTALRVSLTKPKSKAVPTGRATYVANRGTLVFLANNLAPLKGNKVYQLWLMPADGSKPVPAGTFRPDTRGTASVINTRFPRAVPAKGFAVTIENEGGSQTPTLPIILAGA